MNSVSEIICAIGRRQELADECMVAPIAVYRWVVKEAIPARHFAAVLRVAERNGVQVTAKMLCDAHDRREPPAGDAA